MKKLNFTKSIQAPKEKVWSVLWNDKTYREWTSVFSEGSYAQSDWEEGSKILFLSEKGGGMFSMIEKKIVNEFMSFKHLGMIKDGEEQPETEETKKWTGAMENYSLTENNGATELTVTMDMQDDYAKYFEDSFPKALDKVKLLAEQA